MNMWTRLKYFFLNYSLTDFLFCLEGPKYLVRFEGFAMVSIIIACFWNMTPCN